MNGRVEGQAFDSIRGFVGPKPAELGIVIPVGLNVGEGSYFQVRTNGSTFLNEGLSNNDFRANVETGLITQLRRPIPLAHELFSLSIVLVFVSERFLHDLGQARTGGTFKRIDQIIEYDNPKSSLPVRNKRIELYSLSDDSYVWPDSIGESRRLVHAWAEELEAFHELLVVSQEAAAQAVIEPDAVALRYQQLATLAKKAAGAPLSSPNGLLTGTKVLVG